MGLSNSTVEVPVWAALLVVFLLLPAIAWWREKVLQVAVVTAASCRSAKERLRNWLRVRLQQIMQGPADE